MKGDYTCEHCKGTFRSERPDEEAEEELKDLFGTTLEETECVILCDDCWRKLVRVEIDS
jgi:uncharacterized Zn ribbon protein